MRARRSVVLPGHRRTKAEIEVSKACSATDSWGRVMLWRKRKTAARCRRLMRLPKGLPSNDGPERLCRSIPRRSIKMSATTWWNQASFSQLRGMATIFFPGYPANKASKFTPKAAANSSQARCRTIEFCD